MSFGLVGAALAAGIAVSNERGIFMPVGGIDDAVAATARAFTATAAPETPQVDSLYSPPVPIGGIGQAPIYRRIVDVPGGVAGPDVDQPTAFTANAQDEAPAGDMAAAVPAITPTAPAGAATTLAAFDPRRNAAPVVLQPGSGGGTSSSTATTPGPSGTAPDATAVPEPDVWLTLIAGFALVGACLRRARGKAVRSAA